MENNGSAGNLHCSIRGAGVPLLFVHPPILPGTVFERQVSELSPFLQTIVPDLRGHGRSAPSPGGWSFAQTADDVKRLLDERQLPTVYLCGYSAGASIAIEFMLRYPDRVSGAILIGALPEMKKGLLANLIKLGAAIARLGGLPLLAFLGSLRNAQDLSMFRRLFFDSLRTHPADARAYYLNYLHYSCADRMSSLTKPALFLYGEKDILFAPYGHSFAGAVPIAQVRYLPAAGHELPGRWSRALNEQIWRFIQAVESGEFPGEEREWR